MLLVGAAGLRAAEAYVFLPYDAQTLTFYYDNNRSNMSNMGYTYDLNTTWGAGWMVHATDVKEVVFDFSFISARPTCCDFWFSEMSNLTSIKYLSNLNTSRVTSMACMFSGCSKLTSLDVSNFDTEHVTNMYAMFHGCSKLTSLDVSNFDTSNVTNMGSMFQGCSNLSSLDVSNFSTWRVENMSYMFYNCENLTSINVDCNVRDVETMERMFYGCKKLSILDLSSFIFSPGPGPDDLSNESYKEMLGNCTGLKTLIVPASANNLYNNSCIGVGTQSAPCTLFYPDGFTLETTETGDGWYKWKSGYFKDVEPEPYAVISTDNTTLTFYYDTKRISRTVTTYDLNTGSTSPAWRDNAASVTNVVFNPAFADARPTSCHSWFNGMQDLTSISGLNHLNTSQVTDMVAMFTNCWSLTSLNLSGFNTDNVTDMSFMFYGCYDLNNINLSSFNTDNVTNMSYMFHDCPKLESLDVNGFNTANVTDMSYMFNGCSKLSSLDLSGFNTGNVTTMSYMFYDCSGLTSLDVSGFNTTNVSTMGFMFKKCSKLSSLDLSSFTFNSGLSSTDYLKDAIELKTLIIPATAGNLSDGACNGVGTQSAPCALIYPDGFTPETTATGDGWYQWRGGYFKDVVLEPYAVLDDTTLTFYYDKLRTLRTGTTYDLNTVNNTPGWYSKRASVTNVVFDPSFADARPTSCYCWFSEMTHLTSISGMKYLNTSSVTHMRNMFSKCTQLATIDVSHFNTSQVVDMSGMFARCAFTTIDVSNFDTSNITNMMGMFSNCTQLSTIDVSHFNTAQVVDMSGMFEQCAFTTIDVSNFNTSNVTNMKGMFVNDTSLESLDISNFVIPDSTSNYDMGTSLMFANCSNLKTLVVPMTAKNIKHGSCTGVGTYSAPCALIYPDGFTPETTATGNGWYQWKSGYFKDAVLKPYAVQDSTTLTFYYDTCSDSREGTVYDMNTGNTSPGWYVYNYVSVKDVLFHPSFANARPTSCYRWFDGMSQLTSIVGIKYLNTSNVTSMANMFSGCANLDSLDVSGFDTGKVTDMQYMFRGCSSLTSLDVSGFDTGKVTDMSSMFSSCSGLTSLDVSRFDTGKVTDMSDMFYGCTNLTSLDVSGFDTGKVTDMPYMFSGCTNLTSLDVSRFDTGNVTKMQYMFSSCSGLTSLDLSGFMFKSGDNTNYMLRNCTGLQTLSIPSKADSLGNSACTGVGTQSAPCSLIYPDGFDLVKDAEGDGWYQWKSGYFKDAEPEPYAIFNGTTLTFVYDKWRPTVDAETFGMETGLWGMPGWLTKASVIEKVVFAPSFAEYRPTSCAWWFFYMTKATDIINLCYLNTSEVTNMYTMFYGCNSLTSLDVSCLNTANVTNMSSMFQDCSKLTSLDVSNINTENVTNMQSMFSGCSSLTSLDVSGFNTANVTTMEYMFLNCSSLTNLDISGSFNTANVTNMQRMFMNCSSLTSLDVSGFNTEKVYEMADMFMNCSSLTSVNVSGFNTQKVIYMGSMFDNCSSLTSLDLSSFTMPLNNYWTTMMKNCTSLQTLTVPVTAGNMPAGACEGVGTQSAPCTLVYPSDFTLETTAEGDGWYQWKSGYFKDVEPEPYAVLDGTTLTFYYDKLSAERTGTSYALNTGDNNPEWYSNRTSVTNVVFDSSFADARPENCYGWFRDMTNLTSVTGIEYLKTSNVTSMAYMFSNCYRLTSLDVSGFDTGDVTSMTYMFFGCNNLTSLDVSGFDTGNVTSMRNMFASCTNLASLDVSRFDTGNVTDMYSMFFGCTNLASLDVSGFDTGNVTSMAFMFERCTNLASLDVSGFNTTNVTSLKEMFLGCSSLEGIDVSRFNTTNVTNMSAMFYECSLLSSLDVSRFNTTNVTNMSNMFSGCSSLQSLDLSGFTFKSGDYTIGILQDCTGLQTLSIPSTAGYLDDFACIGVGTRSTPCTLVYPSDFTLEGARQYDNYFTWKEGYFCDEAILMGDVNHDGTVNITDVTLTVDKVLGRTPSPFFEENADVMVDGQVTVSDVTAIVNILLHQSASHAPATAREATMDRLWLTSDGGHCLLHLSTPERYTAMHLTLLLPEGGSMGNVRMSASRSAGHHAEMRPIGDGLYNIVLHASDNAELRDGETSLLSFDLAGCQPQDVEVVAIQSTNRLYETVMSAGMATGLEVVETDDAADGDTYNTVGVRVGKNARGVVIKNGNKKIKH